MTYNAYVCTITDIRPHSNADRLALTTLYGSQVVIGIDVKIGDRGIYFPTDGQLSEEFCTQNNLLRKVDSDGNNIGGMFDTNRRVRTQTLRGEKSDGFWMPISCLNYTNTNTFDLPDNTLINDVNGHHICHKYITDKTRINLPREKKLRVKTSYPLFHEHKDTEQLFYNLNDLSIGDYVVITEKLEGTSGRSSNTLTLTPVSGIKAIINRILKRKYFPDIQSYQYVCGSRRVVLSDTYIGYHGDEDKMFRSNMHQNFLGKLHHGESVYYEIVGWQNEFRSIMPTVSNKKLNDKEFIKTYGDTTTFHYNQPPGTQDIYVYRMTVTNDEGYEVDYCWDYVKKRCSQMEVNVVPEIEIGIIDNMYLFQKDIETFVTGPSLLSSKHIREGVVVRIDGTEWRAYKHKSWEYKLLAGIIKDSGVNDVEESS